MQKFCVTFSSSQSARYVYVSTNSNAHNVYSHNNWASSLKWFLWPNFWANLQSMEPNLCEHRATALWLFPNTCVKLAILYWLWLKPSIPINFNQKTTQMCSDDLNFWFWWTCETSSRTRFSLRFTEFVCWVF